MTQQPYIAAVDMPRRLVVMADGLVLPITNLFDDEGEDTDDPDEAVSYVFGAGLTWVTVDRAAARHLEKRNDA